MFRTLITVAILSACTGPNPEHGEPFEGATESPPGLVEWCAYEHRGTVSCFTWEPSSGLCLAWGCERIPRASCPPETSPPWEFTCGRE